jgi:hypothetical protein
MNRRSFLASAGLCVLGATAGCALPESTGPPAGSLRFANEHSVPHDIAMRVTGVGSESGDAPGAVEGDPIVPPPQRELTATAVLDPGETRTYEAVFTEPVWYGVEFGLDGAVPDTGGAVTWHPAPAEGERGSYLAGRVSESGEFSWAVSATEDDGPFEG